MLAAFVMWLGQPAAFAKKGPQRPPRALGPHIQYILKRAGAQRGFWGIDVARLRDGRVLFKLNENHVFTPASNMKLFTTAAALEKLGPEFIFRTTVEAASPPDAHGGVDDLIVVGRGDANIGGRVLPYNLKTERRSPADAVLRELADQVYARGVREVRGNLMADDSYFVYEPYGSDWAEGDLEWGYGAPVTALAFNDNELLLHIQPATSGGTTALASLDPVSDYYRLNNQLLTTEAGRPTHVTVERSPESMELNLWGTVALGSVVDDDTVSIEDPAQMIGQLFLKLLEARGIKVRGKVLVRNLRPMDAANTINTSFPPRSVLAEHDSLPLREDIKVINKVSQNLHAEMLLRTLGRERKNAGSVSAGLDVLRDFAAGAQLSPDQFSFADGSGLSRSALVAPEAVVKLLEYMTRSEHFKEFYDSLPVAGIDGTLAERFTDSPAQGHIHAKTGTMTHVNALSGYMDLPGSDRLVFSIFGNADLLDVHDAVNVVDEITLAIYKKYAPSKIKKKRPTK